MKRITPVLAIILMLLFTSASWALVVIDEGFESWSNGSTLVGQGGWIGPYFQGNYGPSDTNGPVIITSPVSSGSKATRWQCMPGYDVLSATVSNVFPAEWTNGSAVLYLDIAMNATNGPGNFSYFQIFDSSGREATRIYLNRRTGLTGDIHLLGKTSSTSPDAWIPNVVVNPANNVYYKLKLDIDITNKKYDCYVGDGDRSGQNNGHWGHYDANTNLVLDGTPAVNDIYFYYGATGLAKVTWLMYRRGSQFTGSAYAYCDNMYIEGPDDGVGMRTTEIWVAKGTYTEKVTLNQYTQLYGGFAGTETAKEDRNSQTNTTIINAGNTAEGNTCVTGANIGGVDGFTIQGGYYGVDCAHSSMDVTNNIIKGNISGVKCDSGNAIVANNTIVANTFGLSCTQESTAITNNIIANNTTGISSTGGTPILTYNDVYSNAYDYNGLAAGSTDISKLPMFVNQAIGDYHLQLGSPCIDAGNTNSEFYFDKDGAFRPIDGDGDGIATVDIGAYEYQFTPLIKDLPGTKSSIYNSIIRCNQAIITAAWADYFYIEADDRSSGMRVDKTGHGLQAGMRADIIGRIKVNSDGELYIEAVKAVQNGTGSVRPIGLPGKSVGGSDFQYDPMASTGQEGTMAYKSSEIQHLPGLNNIGLLVRTWGKVTWGADSNTFYVNDGSGYDDTNSTTPGIKVILPLGVSRPLQNKQVEVTGISSCYKSNDGLRRLIRTRNASDVVELN